MAIRRHALGFWIAHVAFWAAAYAGTILLCSVFHVADRPAFILAECGLCFVATAAMRRASHHEPLLTRWLVTFAMLPT